MTSLTFHERQRMTRLWLDRAKRSTVSRILHSPLMRWQFGAPVADELLLAPQELRTADASFASEVAQGLFGLGGTVAALGRGSVFDVTPPNANWNRRLHGFAWLRHLSAADSDDAREFAQATVAEWINRYGRRSDIPWSPDVVGRRIFSWLANSELLLSGVNQNYYDRFADNLGRQLIHLSARWRDAPGGLPRLVALNGLLTGALCIEGHDQLAKRISRDFASELDWQIHEDGGHISRNPAASVELLLDLLPLQSCFVARKRQMPAIVTESIPKMLGFLRYMRMGDGSLARFNGMGATPLDSLATLAAYIEDSSQLQASANETGYARLNAGPASLIADVGCPPDMENAAQACAGCLSFELSNGYVPILVNGGTPGPADLDWLAQSRSTASHNTLVLGSKSSSKIVHHPTLESLVGGSPIRMPENVSFSVLGDNDALLLDGQHDGYRKRFGLLHRRRLRLDKQGSWLEGRDQIKSASQQVRLPQDIPFSIHFHLHPDVQCDPEQSPDDVAFTLTDGSVWEFLCNSATVSIEESVHFADRVGPAKSYQIVLRGTCFGDKMIDWRLQRQT